MNENNATRIPEENVCVVCQLHSMKQERQKLKAQNMNLKTNMEYVKCLECLNKICFDCIIGLHVYIVKHIYKCVYEQDPSYLALDNMRRIVKGACNNDLPHLAVSMGPCCSFKKTIPSPTKLTITRPPRPPECQSSNNKSRIDTDMEYIFQNKTQAQEAWRRRKNRIKVKDSSLEFLHAYHEVPNVTTQPRSVILPPHKILHKINQARKSNRKAKKQKKLRLNPFEGGLILPMYELDIEANASENHWTIDHMSLAESEDGTPAVIHGVPSTRCSGCAFDFIIKNNITPIRVNGHTEMFDFVNVASPECDTKTRTHRVCVITLPQIHKAQDCKKFLRQTDFDLHYLIKLKFFGNVDIDSNVDATILLGDFRLEKEVLPEKMFLLRLSGILLNNRYAH